MSTKQLVRISIMGCIQFISFYLFADILYLEAITIVTIVFALVFSKKESILGSIVFCLLNIILKQGLTTWSFMYLIIYPLYSLLIGSLRNTLIKSKIRIVVLCFVLSFMTGQLLQIPYMLISKHITIYYIIFGLKTSLIQATITASVCLIINEVLINTLNKIIRRNKT